MNFNIILLFISPMVSCFHAPKMRFWNKIRLNQYVDVMVPPNREVDFKSTLNSLALNNSIIIENVQEIINLELPTSTIAKEEFNWKKYHTLDQIYRWLQSLAIKYSDVVTLIRGGKSHQGRNITGVKISYREGNSAIFIDVGIHAREWISPATVTFIIDQLLESNNSNVRYIAESRDWYIFPVINPDGYLYSTTTDRFWRKNRRWITLNCVGVDLNRNWGYKWMQGGASDNPCDPTYAGNHAFSEVETKSLSKFINGIAHSLEGYFTFHSYSQMILIPFAYNKEEVPKNYNQLLRIGKNAAKALAKRFGTLYEVGNTVKLLGVASGGSDDWMFGTHRNIKFVYTYELRDTGNYGFLLPPSQIIPTGEETLDSIVSIILQLQDDEDKGMS